MMNRLIYLRIKLEENRGELGISTIISIAIAIIVAGFVLVPGLRGFAESVMTSMTTWWDETIKAGIFPTS